MWLDIVLVIVGALFLVVGTVGVIVPVLPGVPLAWCGLLVAYFSGYEKMPLWLLIAAGIVMIIVSVLDNIFPSMFTKKSGGSKLGSIGSFVGMIIGFFFGPLGIFAGAFLGALAGELIHDHSDFNKSLAAAFGSLKGFAFGIGLKLVAALCFIWIYVAGLIK